MKKVIGILIGLIICGIVGFVYYNKSIKLEFIPKSNNTVEINTEHTINSFVKKIKNGTLKNKNEKVLFKKLGKQKIDVYVINKLKKEIKCVINVNVVDTIKPVIDAKDKISVNEGSKLDLLDSVKVTDNSNEEINVTIEGDYNLKKAGTYKLQYVAKDSSGNIATKDIELVVKKSVTNTKNNTNSSSKYYIKINKTQNVVMVYSKDDAGNYTNLVKTFVASAGNGTPIGTYKTSDKVETLALVGNVWGHYTTRIVKAIWFHSVPYYSKPVNGHWTDLEYEEYNKLGSLASKGCIRLAVIDAKWIYDNIPYGTTVEIYASDTLPEGVVKPSAITIDVNSEYRGWDPTDPDPENPWHR